MNWLVAIRSLGMPPRAYVLRFVLPTLAMCVAAVVALRWALPDMWTGPTASVPWLFPLLVAALLAYYPLLRAEERRAEIDRTIHFFITHVGVLATSSMPRVAIFRLLGEKAEYGAIARESRRIATLVERWNVSLADAARFVGKRSPSRIFSDFLARLAHALDSGEDLPAFLAQEQTTVMNDYANTYRRALYSTEVFKTVYSGLVMSIAFLFIFSMLMPALTGAGALLVMGGALLVALVLEGSLITLARTRAPKDPIWHFAPDGSGTWRALRPHLFACAAASMLLMAWVLYKRPPTGIGLALIATPFAWVGFKTGRLETRVLHREDNYGAFVRSLGASAAAHADQVRPVLKQLQYHDLGALRDDVRALYRRLSLRANDPRAWHLFGARTDSHLILFFNRMFEEGLAYGGRPDAIGTLMSANFSRIVALRKERIQSALAFRGVALGLVIALAAALSVGVGTVRILTSTLASFDTGGIDGVPMPIPSFQPLDFGLVGAILAFAVIGHAAASAVIIGILRGSHPARAAFDLVIFVWLGAIVLAVADGMITTLV